MKTILLLSILIANTAFGAALYSPADPRTGQKRKAPALPSRPTVVAPVITQERVTAEWLKSSVARAATNGFSPAALGGDPGTMYCPCGFITNIGQRLFRARAHQAANSNLVVGFERNGVNSEIEPALFVSCTSENNEWGVTGPGDVEPIGILVGRNLACGAALPELVNRALQTPRLPGVAIDFGDGSGIWVEQVGGGIIALKPGWRLWKKVQ